MVSYTELLPHAGLTDFIYCYWQLKTSTPLTEPFYYRVVADGCIDIFFDARNPSENFVMGFSTTYTEFPLANQFNYTGIRFLPASFPRLFHVNASELTNRFENLKDVLPLLSHKLYEISASKLLFHDQAQLFDQYFLNVISKSDLPVDGRLFNAIDLILKSHGTLNVETDLQTGISPRQLRRLFNFYVGDSPKTFCKVVRFQNILNAKPSTESLRKNKLFYDMGYYDQPHFVKEFKTMYGLTPTIALR